MARDIMSRRNNFTTVAVRCSEDHMDHFAVCGCLDLESINRF